jgi:hypothetical protein
MQITETSRRVDFPSYAAMSFLAMDAQSFPRIGRWISCAPLETTEDMRKALCLFSGHSRVPQGGADALFEERPPIQHILVGLLLRNRQELYLACSKLLSQVFP